MSDAKQWPHTTLIKRQPAFEVKADPLRKLAAARILDKT